MYTEFQNVLLNVGGSQVTLKDFIRTNVIDTPQISVEELQRVLALKPGETFNDGLHAEVTRMK